MPPTIAERLGTALSGRYVLESELGAGGMATVWLARDVRHDRHVAIKVLRPELTAVLGAERFLAEIRLTARLDHPHILTLIDSGTADELLYYVLPYVRGESLRARLDREKQLPLHEAVSLVRQIAGALAYAHSHGVVHRDIKPENILLHEGEAVVTDFGIALALRQAGGTRLTESGLSLGTPQYMSPEQATGDRELDARSDVYSLGAVLYELLAGDPPHAGNTVQAVIAKLLSEKPTSLRTLRSTVPEPLESAVFKALAKVPADRYTSAAQFGDAIAGAVARPTHVDKRTTQSRSRGSLIAMLAVACMVGAAGTWMALRARASVVESAPTFGTAATFFGDVVDFALAPDARQLALGRLICPARGRCESGVEVREVGGGVSLPLARFLATYDLRWSADGRHVHVSGADSLGRFGLFRVSSLGGPVMYLGRYMNAQSVARTDSLMVGSPAPNGVKLGVLMPGESTLRDTAHFTGDTEWALSPDASRVVVVEQSGDRPLIRLMNRRWQTLDSMFVADYYSHPGWSPTGDALLFIGIGNAGLSVRRLRVDVGGDRFRGVPSTVTAPFDMPQSFAGRRLDIANDGTIAYVSGLTPRVLHLMARPQRGALPTVVRKLAGQTGRMRAFIAPNGSTVAFSRLVAGDSSAGDQLIALDLATGQERELSPPLDGLLDAVWSHDGAALIYASYTAGVGTRFTRWERATGQRAPVGTYPERRALGLIWAMPDESLLTVSRDGRSAERLVKGRGAVARSYLLPDRQSLRVIAPSPDGTKAATMSWMANNDSLVIGQLDLATAAWKPFVRMFAEGTGTMRWLDDGSVEFTLSSSVSASELYRLTPANGEVTRLGELPVPFANYNFSLDGRWATAVERRVSADVQLVRPTRR